MSSCQEQRQVKVSFKGVDIDSISISKIEKLPISKREIQKINLSNKLERNIEVAMFNSSSMIDDYQLIFLETNENCLIGEIKKVYLTDSLIFILDSFRTNKLLLYDKKGKFIKQISKRGGGPGEYTEVTDFYFDKTNKHIIIFDQFKSSLMYFSTQGEFLKSKKQLFRYIEFCKLGDQYIYKNLLENGHIPEINQCSMTIGTDSVPFKSVCLPMLELDYINGKLQKLNDSTVSYSIPFCDTIYHYKNKILSAQYVLEIPSKRKLPTDFQNISGNSYNKFRELFPASEYTLFHGYFLENVNHLQFDIVSYENTYTFIYNKQTKELIGGINSVSPNDGSLLDILSFHKPISMGNECFISSISAQTIYKYIENNRNPDKSKVLASIPRLLDVQADDNPILFIFKYKD